MLKKLLAVLLLCLLSCMVPGICPALAEEAEYVELYNPGFEASDTKTEPAWGNNDPSQISIDTTKSHSEKNSLKIHNTKDDAPWIKQQVWDLKENAVYELGAWVNVDIFDTSKGGIGFKIEQYKEDNTSIREASYDNPRFNQNTNDRWVYHGLRFQVHPGAYKIALYIRSYTLGTVWYDDVTLKYIGAPEPYSFFADHVFHYPDEEKGTAVVSLDPFYEADSKEATSVTASFYFKDGETVLDKKENVELVNREASYSYPVSIMKEKKKRYNLITVLQDTEGEILHEWMENMYLYDRPALMPENGKFIIDDKPFYPVIGYHTDMEDYMDLVGSGINTLILNIGICVEENQITWIPEFNQTGLKAFVALYPGMKPAGHPDNETRTKATMEALRDNSNILGWMVMDEPMGAGLNMEEMKKHLEASYILIRELDPTRPVYLLDYGNHRETIKYCDVFVADVYCRGDSAVGVSQVIEPLTKNHPRISTFELAAAFKSGGVFPPIKTIRASVYRGIEAGGSYGTGYYAISDAIGHDEGDEKKPLYELDDVWDDIKALSLEEIPVMFELYGNDGVTIWNESREGELYKELIWKMWYNEKGEWYFFAHNRGENTVIKDIPLTNKEGTLSVCSFSALPLGLTAGTATGKDKISVILDKEDIVLYKITPKSVRALYDGVADMYAGVYAENGRELTDISVAFGTENGIEVAIPESGASVLEIFAFNPGSIQPQCAKKRFPLSFFAEKRG